MFDIKKKIKGNKFQFCHHYHGWIKWVTVRGTIIIKAWRAFLACITITQYCTVLPNCLFKMNITASRQDFILTSLINLKRQDQIHLDKFVSMKMVLVLRTQFIVAQLFIWLATELWLFVYFWGIGILPIIPTTWYLKMSMCSYRQTCMNFDETGIHVQNNVGYK